jgi:hypothetical protein
MNPPRLAALAFLGYLAGCGEVVTSEPPPSTGGAGGAGAGAAGQGGAAGEGAAPVSCAGIGAKPCGDGEYCETPPGACDADGECVAQPDGCFEECTGVCGCDGELYCNACEAALAGVSVSLEGDCIPDEVAYRAHLWLGGLDHLVLMKQNLTQDTCVRLYADWPGTSNYPDVAMADGWEVSNVEAWPTGDGCLDEQAFHPDAITATEAHGSIEWMVEPGMYYPCFLDATVAFAFDPAPPWLGATANMSAAELEVDGGCL